MLLSRTHTLYGLVFPLPMQHLSDSVLISTADDPEVLGIVRSLGRIAIFWFHVGAKKAANQVDGYRRC